MSCYCLKICKIVNLYLQKFFKTVKWLNVNRLSLNLNKTNYVIFQPFNKPLKHQVTIKIQKIALSQKTHVEYLGVIIDSTFSWKQQIKNITCKISRAISVVYLFTF